MTTSISLGLHLLQFRSGSLGVFTMLKLATLALIAALAGCASTTDLRPAGLVSGGNAERVHCTFRPVGRDYVTECTKSLQ